MPPPRRDQRAFQGSLPDYIIRKVHVIVQFDEHYEQRVQYTCTRCKTMWIILAEPEDGMLHLTRPCPHCFKASKAPL